MFTRGLLTSSVCFTGSSFFAILLTLEFLMFWKLNAKEDRGYDILWVCPIEPLLAVGIRNIPSMEIRNVRTTRIGRTLRIIMTINWSLLSLFLAVVRGPHCTGVRVGKYSPALNRWQRTLESRNLNLSLWPALLYRLIQTRRDIQIKNPKIHFLNHILEKKRQLRKLRKSWTVSKTAFVRDEVLKFFREDEEE